MFEKIQQQFRAFWSKQTFGQRLVILVLTIAGAVLLYVFITWANTPSYAVAYSGLSDADAGQIVDKLSTSGIPYKLEGAGTIQVPSNKVYETRMLMAREGLPQGDGTGFEVFNGNTLGMTNFSQEVNYQQALESELEQTIGNMSAINAVRVHVVTPEKSLLSSDQAPTTASVVVDLKGSAFLDVGQVQAITHLVSSSVEGLRPEHVVVADMNGNLLASGQGPDGSSPTSQVDSRRAAELAAAATIKSKVQGILDSALGPNRAVVQAVVTMDWTEREVVTQAYNPETAAVRSSQSITETYSSTGQLPEGVPGAETNLPDEIEDAASSEEGMAYQRQEETTNYELTQTETVEMYPAGDIQTISLSVLVDGLQDEAQLASIRSTVAAAAGIDESRGDVLAVESMAFDRTYFEEQATEMAASERMDLYITIAKNAGAVLGLAAVLWYIMQTLKRIRVKSTQAWTPVYQSVGALTGAGAPAPGLPGPTPQPQLNQGVPVQQPAQPSLDQPAAPTAPAPAAPAVSTAAESLMAENENSQELNALSQHLAGENPAEIADVVRMWINEE